VEKVLEEIQSLIDTYSIREVQFEDSNLLYDREWAYELFRKMVEKGWSLSWCAPSGLCLWNLDDELLEWMRKSGLYAAWLAVDSGSPRVLEEVVGRPGDLGKVRSAVRTMRRLGVAAKGIFSLGFPGETKEEMNSTVNFALSSGFADVRFQVATPFPGMPMWEECLKKGFMDRNVSFKDLMLPQGLIETPDFTRKDVTRFWEWGTSRIRFHRALFDPAMLTEKLPKLIMAGIRHPAETMVSLGKSFGYLMTRSLH
jgi:radical SAM superfamily enzyme YgiQ (UPF0313 family)